MTSRLAAAATAAHRFIFIASTAILAVGTSRIADRASDTGSWLLTTGSAIIMYTADMLSTIERDSEELASSTATSRHEARIDLLEARTNRSPVVLLAAGSIALGLGAGWEGVSTAIDHLTGLSL